METGPGRKILIIEDESDVSDLLEMGLRKAGFKTSAATDGATGLQKARDDRPDFIILDLMLPKMSGLEVCRILKGDAATSHIPILMLTAKAEEIDRIVGLEFGADDYVTKPFSPREVTLRIRAILRRGEKQEETLQAGSIVIDPARLNTRDSMMAEIDAMIDWVKSAAPSDPELPVLVAGEPERIARAQRLAKGIEVDDETWSQLTAIAERYQIAVDR